jgi:hypothetical protein
MWVFAFHARAGAGQSQLDVPFIDQAATNDLLKPQKKHPPDVTLKSQLLLSIFSSTALEPGTAKELEL